MGTSKETFTLTCCKQEANPSLTWVLFDPAQRDFFDPKWKKWKNLGF